MRKCSMCDVAMPQGTHSSRKYCDDCTGNRARERGRVKRGSCSSCGKPVHKTRAKGDWQPPTQHVCRECRAGGRDAEQIRADQRARVRAANMSPCADCGTSSYGARCRRCDITFRRGGQPIGDITGTTARKLLDARRADRDKLAPGIYTPTKRQQLRAKWIRQGKTCLYCGTAAVQEVDHVLPLSLGGTNHEGNLAPACHDCNRLKQDNLLSAWRYGVKVRRWRVPVAPRTPGSREPKRKKVAGEQTSLRLCTICGSMHTRGGLAKYCSDGCMQEANARAARDRYRARKGLPVDREAPTKPTKRYRRAA